MARGLAFDAAIFAANAVAALWLVERLSARGLDDPGVRALVAAAIVAQAAGALLKGPVLRWRRAKPLGALAASLFASGLLLNLAISSLLLLGSRAPGWTLVLPVASTLCLATAWSPASPRQTPPARPTPAREAAADALLWFPAEVVLLLFAAFLAPLVSWREGGAHLRDDVPLGLAILLATLFQTVFFYAPFRLPLLLEDARRPATWLQMALALLPLHAQVILSWRALPLRLACVPREVVLAANASAAARCALTAGPRFAGEVRVTCEPLGGAALVCSATPDVVSLAAGESATIRLELRADARWSGESAVRVWADGPALPAARDVVVRVRGPRP